MSVAFRRESDEEHKEPQFELPLPPGPNLVTARGLSLINAKVVEWEARLAAAEGDDAVKAAKRDLRYWQTRQSTAELPPVPDTDEVAFGSRVTFTLARRERTLDIVGSDEADPNGGSIPFTAPLAQAMIGLEPGECADWNGAPDAIEILSTGPIPPSQ